MKVTDVLAQKRALRVTDVLAHPGNRCPGTCHLGVSGQETPLNLNFLAKVDIDLRYQISILNSAPLPTLHTVSLPPIFFSMMAFDMNRPIPVPLSGPLVVK
jgi:hypothetical protein